MSNKKVLSILCFHVNVVAERQPFRSRAVNFHNQVNKSLFQTLYKSTRKFTEAYFFKTETAHELLFQHKCCQKNSLILFEEEKIYIRLCVIN